MNSQGYFSSFTILAHESPVKTSWSEGQEGTGCVSRGHLSQVSWQVLTTVLKEGRTIPVRKQKVFSFVS